MKPLTFGRSTIVALALAVAGSLLFSLLTPVVGHYAALRSLIAALGFGYVAFLISRSRRRYGAITTLTTWSLASLGLWFLIPGLSLYLLMHVLLIWLVRSLHRYSSVYSSLLDLGVSMASLGAGLWAAQSTGSLFLSVWCVFLAQAGVAFIPAQVRQRGSANQRHQPALDNFDRAERAAQAALQRLSAS